MLDGVVAAGQGGRDESVPGGGRIDSELGQARAVVVDARGDDLVGNHVGLATDGVDVEELRRDHLSDGVVLARDGHVEHVDERDRLPGVDERSDSRLAVQIDKVDGVAGRHRGPDGREDVTAGPLHVHGVSGGRFEGLDHPLQDQLLGLALPPHREVPDRRRVGRGLRLLGRGSLSRGRNQPQPAAASASAWAASASAAAASASAWAASSAACASACCSALASAAAASASASLAAASLRLGLGLRRGSLGRVGLSLRLGLGRSSRRGLSLSRRGPLRFSGRVGGRRIRLVVAAGAGHQGSHRQHSHESPERPASVLLRRSCGHVWSPPSWVT